jgi:hypothetical protein
VPPASLSGQPPAREAAEPAAALPAAATVAPSPPGPPSPVCLWSPSLVVPLPRYPLRVRGTVSSLVSRTRSRLGPPLPPASSPLQANHCLAGFAELLHPLPPSLPSGLSVAVKSKPQAPATRGHQVAGKARGSQSKQASKHTNSAHPGGTVPSLKRGLYPPAHVVD